LRVIAHRAVDDPVGESRERADGRPPPDDERMASQAN
jgi:hypothetical protein